MAGKSKKSKNLGVQKKFQNDLLSFAWGQNKGGGRGHRRWKEEDIIGGCPVKIFIPPPHGALSPAGQPPGCPREEEGGWVRSRIRLKNIWAPSNMVYHFRKTRVFGVLKICTDPLEGPTGRAGEGGEPPPPRPKNEPLWTKIEPFLSKGGLYSPNKPASDVQGRFLGARRVSPPSVWPLPGVSGLKQRLRRSFGVCFTVTPTTLESRVVWVLL